MHVPCGEEGELTELKASCRVEQWLPPSSTFSGSPQTTKGAPKRAPISRFYCSTVQLVNFNFNCSTSQLFNSLGACAAMYE